jgi:tRNA A-37 threonylcarbamoyl transferase component Bud32
MNAASVPRDFVVRRRGPFTLVADERWVEAALRAGLDTPQGWAVHLANAARAPGRGATARIVLEPGRVARLKQLRRGGWLAGLWRDRFAGRRRALDNLRLGVEVARRGVPTPAPLALLLERAAPGRVRAWLAVEEIEDAEDLATRFALGRPPCADELDAVLGLVRRMHERGIDHRDLNLGNLLLRPGPQPRAWVIDLDRARLGPGALSIGRRRRALRRLERSYVKSCHPGPAADAIRRALFERYAAGDAELLRRLVRGPRAAAVWLRLHRLGWGAKRRAP